LADVLEDFLDCLRVRDKGDDAFLTRHPASFVRRGALFALAFRSRSNILFARPFASLTIGPWHFHTRVFGQRLSRLPDQRIDLIHFLDQRCPSTAREFLIFLDFLNGRRLYRSTRLFPNSARLIRIVPVIPDEMLRTVRDVLGHLSKKIERLEYLEIADHSRQCRYGFPVRKIFFRILGDEPASDGVSKIFNAVSLRLPSPSMKCEPSLNTIGFALGFRPF